MTWTKNPQLYYMQIVTCDNCKGTKSKDGFTYSLEVHKFGKLSTCKTCNQIKYPNEIKRDYWFCCRKCLEEFLEKHKKEDFKRSWEEPYYGV